MHTVHVVIVSGAGGSADGVAIDRHTVFGLPDSDEDAGDAPGPGPAPAER